MKTLKLSGVMLRTFTVRGWYSDLDFEDDANPDRVETVLARDESNAEQIADLRWSRAGHKCQVISAESK